MTMLPKNIRKGASLIDLTRCFAASDRQRAITRRSQALLAAAGMEEPARRWFVVTVDHNADRAVAETLAFADVEVWMPCVSVKSKRRRSGMGEGPRKAYERLAFQGYVFVKIASTVNSWAGLRSVKGVSGILGSDGRPVAIDDAKISLLKLYLAEDADAVKVVSNAISAGDKVIVRDGPFCSFPGKVDDVDHDKGWAIVELLIFGRITPVHLDLAQISKL